MAFPLSSAIVSHKLSLNVPIAPSTRRPNLKPTHFITYANRKNPERSGCSRVHCMSNDNHPKVGLDPTCILGFFKFCLIAVILVFVQISSPLPLVGWDVLPVSSPANAVLCSPDTKVPRTGELALRRAIPANTNMKTIQNSTRKPYGTMEGNVKKALKIATDEKDTILASVPTDLREKGSILYASLINGKVKDPDKVSVGLASSLDTIAELGIRFSRFPDLFCWLTGRGTVELTIEKGDGSTISPEAGGEPRKTATIQYLCLLISIPLYRLDGYSAPLTAGNFAKLVIDEAYNGTKLSSTNQAILSYNGLDKNSGNSLPILPLSVYGAVAMAHSEVSEEYSSPYQFFFHLYGKRYAGLGGLSFDEGEFSVFGEILSQIKSGDVIRSAKLVEGQDCLPDFLGAGCAVKVCSLITIGRTLILGRLHAFNMPCHILGHLSRNTYVENTFWLTGQL
ncbi:unnamed protein product [Malus baccata var. baccata]